SILLASSAASDVYKRQDKIAIGGGYPAGTIDLDASVTDNLKSVAKAKGVAVSDVNVCVLDRPRHAGIISEIRKNGAKVSLITDGDIAGVIATTDKTTGIDMYIGIGGAPEGVLAAAALRCIGGQMQGRLITDSDSQKARAAKMGIKDFDRKYEMNEMARGDVIFAATGVTDGDMLDGIKLIDGKLHTHTIVMRSYSGTVRYIRAEHGNTERFTG
ncbi:MAG: fructose-bisphosphatase class II, partial [Parvibaculaceae bacterium]|nr:fructose-bisphosphatase class II [Parvibaculaceae bacterium]